MAKRMRYKQIDQLLTRVLLADTAIFVLYLIFAAAGLSFSERERSFLLFLSHIVRPLLLTISLTT